MGGCNETLFKLKKVIRPGSYIINDAYAGGNSPRDSGYNYMLRSDWLKLFNASGLKITGEIPAANTDYSKELENLKARAGELSDKYPQLSDTFNIYIQRRENAYKN